MEVGERLLEDLYPWGNKDFFQGQTLLTISLIIVSVKDFFLMGGGVGGRIYSNIYFFIYFLQFRFRETLEKKLNPCSSFKFRTHWKEMILQEGGLYHLKKYIPPVINFTMLKKIRRNSEAKHFSIITIIKYENFILPNQNQCIS